MYFLLFGGGLTLLGLAEKGQRDNGGIAWSGVLEAELVGHRIPRYLFITLFVGTHNLLHTDKPFHAS